MIRKTVIIAVLSALACVCQARDRSNFVSVGFGGNVTFGENDRFMQLSDHIAPTFDIRAGHWFTPMWGASLGFDGFKFKGLYTDAWIGQHFTTGIKYPNPNGSFKYPDTQTLYRQEASFVNVHADVMLNLTHLIYRDGGTRFYQLIPSAGLGWITSFGHDGDKGSALSVDGALQNRLNVARNIDLNIVLKATVYSDSFDGEVSGKMSNADGSIVNSGEQNINFDAMLALTVGIVYRF